MALVVWIGVTLPDGSHVRFKLLPIYQYMKLKRRWACTENLMQSANNYAMNETMRRQAEHAAHKNLDDYFVKLDQAMGW